MDDCAELSAANTASLYLLAMDGGTYLQCLGLLVPLLEPLDVEGPGSGSLLET